MDTHGEAAQPETGRSTDVWHGINDATTLENMSCGVAKRTGEDNMYDGHTRVR